MVINKILAPIAKYEELMLLVLLLITLTLKIRIDYFYETALIVINSIIIIYLLIRMITTKPIRLIQSKLDVCVLILVISTAIPLLFNTYISLYATTISILNYVSLFWIYILAREMANKDSKNVEIMVNIIIFTAICLIVVGIENLTTNRIFRFFNINYIINGENRLVSLFGNPNTLAAFIAFAYLLSINNMSKMQKLSSKVLYGTANTICIIGIILTYSKVMYLILPIVLMGYILCTKDKMRKIRIIQNTILSIVLGVIYTYIFLKLLAKEEYLAILIFSCVTTTICVLINIFNMQIEGKLCNIKPIKALIVLLIIIILASVWVTLELKNSKEFVVFNENSTSNYNAKKITNIKQNEKYIFRFDMDAKYKLEELENREELFKINIIQRDNKNIEITHTQESFGNFCGMKEIEIETTPHTAEIKIEFETKYESLSKNWTIKNLKINEEEYILEYKHLPTKLVEKVKDISIHYKTAQERIQFIKDAFKIISKNFVTGYGGNAWQYQYKEVQEYGYETNDPHSYITQIWIEFGIVGIFSFIGIISIIITQKENNMGIKFAIIALVLHCIIDSDMYFMYMRVILFLSLGMLSRMPKEKVIKKFAITNLLAVMMQISVIGICMQPQIYNKQKIITELEESKIGLHVGSPEYKQISYSLYEAYDNITNYERETSSINLFETKKVQSALEAEKENLEMVVEEYYKKIKDYTNTSKHNIKKIVEKSNHINNVLGQLQSIDSPQMYTWIAKLTKLNIDEFEDTKKELENVIQEKYESTDNVQEYQTFLSNYKAILKLYNEYMLGIKVKNATQIDIGKYINDEKIDLNNTNEILIYHTHTSEAYGEKDRKTTNANENMIKVGKTLSKQLKNKGINVIHIQKYHDLESVSGAYDRSLKTVDKTLKEQNKKIDIIFDIHRDSYPPGLYKTDYIEIEGKKAAKLRFVIAIGHENWENNLKWAIKLQKKADELYPGLFKEMFIYDDEYNQSIASCATLVEVGSDELNTIGEACNSMTYFSNVIDSVMQDEKYKVNN